VKEGRRRKGKKRRKEEREKRKDGEIKKTQKTRVE
jgi:hypothetical protein